MDNFKTAKQDTQQDVDMIFHETVEAYSYDLEEYSDGASEMSDEQLRLFLKGQLPPQDYIEGPPDMLPCGHCCQQCHKRLRIN